MTIPISWLVLAAGIAIAALGLLAFFASGMSTNIEATRKAEKQGTKLLIAGAIVSAASRLI